MFNLSYLSNENKVALEKLQERLSRASSEVIREQTRLYIQEIEAKAKPYQECDLIEADELRSQLIGKINILARLGKSTEPFLVHLRDVDFHIQTLQMKETMKEAERFAPEEGPNLKDKVPTLGKMDREKKRKEAFGGLPRWQIGFEDEPDDAETKQETKRK